MHVLAHKGCQPVGQTLKDNTEGACLVQSHCVLDEPLRCIKGPCLNAIAPKGVDGLWSETKMPHDRDACAHHFRDHGGKLPAALDLHAIGAAFCHESTCVNHGIAQSCPHGHKGHVREHKGLFRTPRDRTRMVDHVLHGDRDRILVAKHDHPQTVPYKEHVRTSFGTQFGHGVVVGRDHTDLYAVRLFPLQIRQSDGHDRNLALQVKKIAGCTGASLRLCAF